MWQPFKQIYYLAPDNAKLYFFEGRTRALQSWHNFGMPEINFIEDRGPNQHGTTVRDWRAQTRTITLDWFGQRCDGRQCEYAAVIEKIRPTHAGSPGYLRVINQDTSLLEIPAWIQQGPAGNWSIDSGLRNLQVRDALQFHCADPIWREAVQRTATATLEVVDSCLPFCLPMCLGSGLLSADFNICYNGTWPGDQITFVITGPIDTPTITNSTTGQVIQLNYNIAANETVTIVILPEFISVTSNISGNIIGTVTNVSDLVFFNLAPRQANIVTLSGVNAIEGSSSISMRYYTRYLSVYDSCVQIECEEEVVNPDAFITSWNTSNVGTSNSDQITLPLHSTGTYNFIVDWGDDSNQDTITAWNQAETTHTYATPGIYTVTIAGQFSRIFFNNSGDRLKLLSIIQWGDVGWGTNQGSAFWGCENLSALPDDHIEFWNDTITSANRMFQNTNLSLLPAAMTLDSLTNGPFMFAGTGLISLPSGMVLSQLTTASSMFFGTSLVSLPSVMTLAALVTGNFMFFNVPITSLPSAMVLDVLTNGDNMFADTSLASLPANMILPALLNGTSMFDGTALTSVPSVMTLASITTAPSMFFGTTLATGDYSQLLINIEANNNNNGVAFHGGNSQYSAGAAATARAALIADHSWIITDGGPA